MHAPSATRRHFRAILAAAILLPALAAIAGGPEPEFSGRRSEIRGDRCDTSGLTSDFRSLTSEMADAAPPRELQLNLTVERLETVFKAQVAKRFTPIWVSTHYGLRGKPVIAVIWEKHETGEFKARYGLTREAMKKEIDSSADAGFRLSHLTALGSGGKAAYSALWDKAPGQELAVRYEFPEREVVKLDRQFAAKKYAIHRIMVTDDSGKIGFTAAWEKAEGEQRELQLGVSETVFQREVRERPKKGYRLRQAFGYVDRRRARIACIWEKRDGPSQVIRAPLSEVALKKSHKQLTAKGLLPAMITGYAVNGRDRYIAVWEKPKAP